MSPFPRTKDAQSFPPLEAGWYVLQVLGVEDREDKNGNSFWNVEFLVVDQDPRKVWDNFRPDENWLWKLKAFIECIDPNLSEREVDFSEICGKEVMAYIVPDKQYSRIKQYESTEEPTPSVPKTGDDEAIPF